MLFWDFELLFIAFTDYLDTCSSLTEEQPFIKAFSALKVGEKEFKLEMTNISSQHNTVF